MAVSTATVSFLNGERAVVVLVVARILFSLPSSLLFHGVSLSLLLLAALFLEIRAETSSSLPTVFNARPGASSGILLGAVTLPAVMLSKLILLRRAYLLHEIEPEELEHITMQYWATSASCCGVLIFLWIILWCESRNVHPSSSRGIWEPKFSLSCILLYAALCLVSLATISHTGLNAALKWLWILFHGFASVKLIQHLLCTFPYCASIGEALLVTGGLVLYFGDMLACSIAKVFERSIPTKLVSIQYGIKRSEISIIIQGVLLGLLLVPLVFKFVLHVYRRSFGKSCSERGTDNEIVKSLIFFSSLGFILLTIVPSWMQFVQDFNQHPLLWVITFVFSEPLAPLIRPVDSLPEPCTNPPTKGIPVMLRAQTSHPLDPLSAAEISVAVATVRAAGATPEVRDSMRFIEVVLLEPDKHVVALADAYFFPPFQPSLLPKSKGGPIIPTKLPPRRARLVVYNKKSNETSVWVVELSEVHAVTRGGHHRGKVVSSQVVANVQPPMDAAEYAECEAVVKAFPQFMEAMKKRGIEDMDLVMVDPWCVGYYSNADAPSRRLAKPLIFCRTESDSPMENGYARPVEGIYVLVDMQNMMVIEFEDRKLVPLPPADPLRNYTPGETRGGVDRSDVKPLQILQPEGPSFRVNGSFVEWQKWNFRIGFTPREGLVIYSVAYVDGSRGRRPVAHRLSFVEMVVPYGDPNDPHYRKNAFDAGEDGLGKNAHSLKKGCDCLGYIKYFDAHFTNFTGGVETIENCVCLHEEDHGILWKHQDWRTGLAEVRRSRRLTVSFICTVANYEYGFFWHFYQDGRIEAEVKLTGILSLGALQPGEFRKYGIMIAPGLYAPVHQHFFVARMDMAVDCKPGETFNQVVEVDVKVEEPGENNVHNNAFYAEERLLKSELQAMRDCNPLTARHWIVRNTRTVNRTGQLTGYKLVPGSNCLPLARPEAKFLRRAAFLKHNLWVTPYARDEMYPGGEFPNQNPRVSEGLATWVKQNRSLEETDIVLWYVFGITHVPRLEDWPVMPVERIGFMLMPHGFFNCSPAVDVPPNACELDVKDNDVKDNGVAKPVQNELLSKL